LRVDRHFLDGTEGGGRTPTQLFSGLDARGRP
jgi:hypothetical protein